MFIGMGGDADGDIDLPEADGDVSEMPEIDPDIDDVADAADLYALHVFTMRGMLAFLVVFGWVGALMDSSSCPLALTIPVATASGFAMMVLIAYLMRVVMRLRNDGNADNRNAIGVSGRVQLTIPPERSGTEKVHIMLQGAYVERGAVTDEDTPIPTGAEIVVVGVSGDTDLVVRRK
jgi:membrane protein implicated in regulation of membrane protease activity